MSWEKLRTCTKVYSRNTVSAGSALISIPQLPYRFCCCCHLLAASTGLVFPPLVIKSNPAQPRINSGVWTPVVASVISDHIMWQSFPNSSPPKRKYPVPKVLSRPRRRLLSLYEATPQQNTGLWEWAWLWSHCTLLLSEINRDRCRCCTRALFYSGQEMSDPD